MTGAEAYLPTGGQFGIVHGDQSRIVAEVGATLRSFSVAGLELLDAFGVDEWTPPKDLSRSHTGDTPPEEDRRRDIAIELMTRAPNAFNSGDGLRGLTPGEPFASVWSMACR